MPAPSGIACALAQSGHSSSHGWWHSPGGPAPLGALWLCRDTGSSKEPRDAPRNSRHQGWVEISCSCPRVGRRVLVWSRGGPAPGPSRPAEPSEDQALPRHPNFPAGQRGSWDGRERNSLTGGKRKTREKKAASAMWQSMTIFLVYHFIQHWPHGWGHTLVQLLCTKPTSRTSRSQPEKSSCLQWQLF